MTPVLLFDLNETLIDFSELDPWFDQQLGIGARDVWFAELLRISLICNSIGEHRSFSILATEALQTISTRYETCLPADAGQALGHKIRSLSAHPEVPAALQRIAASEQYRLAVLTNSPATSATAQIENAGLASYFEKILSVDPAGCFKPRPEPYFMAAEELDTTLNNVTMIAAHDWDIAGAMQVGAQGILIRRPGLPYNPALVTPTLITDNLSQVVEHLIPD